MPSVSIRPLDAQRKAPAPNGLPALLHTPSGLALVEVQGTIHTPAQPTSQTTGGGDGPAGQTPVGRLVFPDYSAQKPAAEQAWMKRVYLYVGKHQRMTGEVKKLPKALGVLRKRAVAGEDAGQEELEISEVIKYKIVFSQRPEPVGGE